jgi:hypothetical protein
MDERGRNAMSPTMSSADTTEHRNNGDLDKVDEASSESMDASDPPAFGGATGIGTPEPSDERVEQVRRRAYELWQEAGSPADREMEFWLQAEREIGTR